MNRCLVWLLALLLPLPVLASEIIVQWNAPTARADEMALDNAEIAKYNLQIKTPENQAFSMLGEVISEAVKTHYDYHYPLGDSSGEYCFQLQTEDIHGLISEWSESVCATYVALKNPKLPANITIEIKIGP